MNSEAVERFRRDGFVVLRRAFDPGRLAKEMEQVFGDGILVDTVIAGAGGIGFWSVPMMSRSTPVSMSLAGALADRASRLLGRPVLPGRAKGTRYLGESDWHTDSKLDLPSVGFVAYLEALRGGSGALEVRPGSHRRGGAADHRGPVALDTRPGDIVAFDEHLMHGSVGGDDRRQWRVDYFADPRDEHEEMLVHELFAQIFDPGWDGGYDAVRYPSYGLEWQKAHPQWASRLRDLGVVELARAQEAVMLQNRKRSRS